ncbi:hypothetical protein KUTeg_009063 [Tegillarca granosa]|uniref:Uncharacterized protein n=1 Tax=Tegillarca granosa TaxID=220873 RepID=A0ABQ9F7N3_TEGGR|nr:hypothetical protein KUTeg_009063 [Tegillarca granosa]
MWGDQKTTLSSVDTSPGEKSSLLTGKGSPDHKDPSKNRLLSEDDDSWDGWGGEDWKDKNSPDSPESTPEKEKPTKKEESFDTGNDDELEAWLNDDTPLHSSKVDLSEDTTTSANENSGWDNEVWADEDDEWQSLDIGSSESIHNITTVACPPLSQLTLNRLTREVKISCFKWKYGVLVHYIIPVTCNNLSIPMGINSPSKIENSNRKDIMTIYTAGVFRS